MINQQHQESNQWCSRASRDPACRIRGWPVLNATSVCAPSQPWLFGDSGGCCSEASQAIDLANWVAIMCNGTWQDQFKSYALMAQSDWWQWELPWNWTVQVD